MALMQQVSASRLFSEKLKMELYPPFFFMRVKIHTLRNSWREVRIKLPLNTFSRNPGGVMFGGYQACLADPIAALACSRVFPGYSCWTRAMSIDFVLGGSTDLELRFDFDPELEEQIRKDLATKGRSTPTFNYGYYLKDGTLCTKIENVVAIRPKGYIGATTPPAAGDDFSGVGEKIEDMLKKTMLMDMKGSNEDVKKVWEELMQADFDSTGGIDLRTFEPMVKKVCGDKVTQEEIELLFKVLDKDNSGLISLSEAREWWKRMNDDNHQ
jgi:acyl-coenzyme A thioesterase PaaI-like protein